MDPHYVVLRWLALLSFAAMTMGCQPICDVTDTLIAKDRQPKETLDDEDYEILMLVLEHICVDYSADVVALEPTTLAREYLVDFRRKESLKFLKYRFHVNAASFCQLAPQMPLTISVESSALHVKPASVDEVPSDGVRVGITPPVLSASGRAFVYAIATSDHGGGGVLYCLTRDQEKWSISESVTLVIYD